MNIRVDRSLPLCTWRHVVLISPVRKACRKYRRIEETPRRTPDAFVCGWVNIMDYREKSVRRGSILLTCICLRRHFFRVTSLTACNIRDVTPGILTATDTCIGYHVTRFEASRNVILHTRYVNTCVGAGCGRSRGTKKNKSNPLWRMLL
jgi:hypothetical protein